MSDLNNRVSKDSDSMEAKQIRVLLVTSVSARGFGFYDAPPVGLYRLKHYIGERGIHCDILDLDMESKEPFLLKVEQGFYNIIGFSVSHYSMEADLGLLWEFQAVSRNSGKKCVFIAGGQEATLNYEQWLNAGVEFILTGFGEKVLYEFCLKVLPGNEMDKEAYNLEGIICRNKVGKTVINPARILTQPEFEELSYHQVLKLDLPFKKYWDRLGNETRNLNINSSKFVIENVRLYTTSHCPRKCGFCSSQSFLHESQKHNTKIFMLTAGQIHSLILLRIKKDGARSFLFSDDDFPVGNAQGLKRIYDLCEMITASKEKGDIPGDVLFNCQARIADFIIKDSEGKGVINYKLMDLLHKAGFQSFGLGVETFSDRLLKCRSINKVGVNAIDCKNVLDALLDKGLVPQINIIVGIPESTADELLETVRTAVEYIEKGCLVAVSNKLFMIPGSPIYYDNTYEIFKIYKKNPFTGVDIEITKYVIPRDEKIRCVVENLEDSAAKELEQIVKNTVWESSIVPRTVLCLAYFVAAARLLERTELAESFYRVTDNIKQKSGV